MKISYVLIAATLLALITIASAQNPIDAFAGSLQEKVNAAGQELQQKAVTHIVEGNLTQEHVAQELKAAKENLTTQATKEISENLNITPGQLQEKATQELKNQAIQKIEQQPGFPAALALFGMLAIVCLMRRRN
jgi:PGF-CTERM protein